MRQSLAHLAVLLLLGLAMWAPVQAAEPFSFNVPTQPLDEALHAFSQQSGMAVLVDRELTRQRRSMTLQGRFTARAGLRRLLEGTGLEAHYSSAEAFTVQPMRIARAAANGPGKVAPGVGNYALAIQQAVERALCRGSLTRPGSYRAALQVWIDRRGVLAQTRLLASTGDVARDLAVIDALRALRLARKPPGGLAQPVTLLLRPAAPGMNMDCATTQGATAA